MRTSHTLHVLLGFGAAVSAFVPAVAFAAAPKNLAELANMLAKMFNAGSTTLVMVALILVFGGIVHELLKKYEILEGQSKFGGYVMSLIFAFFIMVSVWGLVRLLQGTFFGGSQSGSSPSQQQLEFE